MCMWRCVSQKGDLRRRECVLVWLSLICAPVYGSLPLRQGRTARGGGHLTGHRWYQQTDCDGGDTNTLINNYVNNDTGYTGAGGWGWGGKEMEGRRGQKE